MFHRWNKRVLAGATVVVAGSVALALSGSAAGSGSTQAPTSVTASGPFSAAAVPALAKRVAADFGDANPTTIQYSTGTREAANLAMSGGGDEIPDQINSHPRRDPRELYERLANVCR